MMNPIDESSFSDADHGNIILSDVASWSALDSDCFYMRDSVYRALDEDSSGDVIFPLHEKCVQLAYRVLDFRCGEKNPGCNLDHNRRLYQGLKKRYLDVKHTGIMMYADIISKFPTVHSVDDCGRKPADTSRCCCMEIRVLLPYTLVVTQLTCALM
jgi:hypothetical protein